MIINGKTLLEMAPIRDMIPAKRTVNGISHGLTECGYDIRLKQEVIYRPCASNMGPGVIIVDGKERINDRFFLGSSIEYFDMPPMLMGRVLNKSTWAREGVDCSMATNIEPGWRGNLTIELIFNRAKEVHIPAGVGICQIIFERILNTAQYEGKYQDQEDRPVEAKLGDPRHPEYLANMHRLPEWHAEKAVQNSCRHSWDHDMSNNLLVCRLCGEINE